MEFNPRSNARAIRLIEQAIEKAIEQKQVTYDFERQMEGATLVSCSGFGDVLIENIRNS